MSRLEVTKQLNGSPLSLCVHIVNGVEPGPTLVLLSALHGGEWFSVLPLRRIVAETNPGALKGTLVVVPVANPPALGFGTRNAPDQTDSPDLNRVFPGSLSSANDQIANAITHKVLERATHLLDVHVGPWGTAFWDVVVGNDYLTQDVSDASERLALEFGSPTIRRTNIVSGFPGPRSAIGYAGGVLGIPSIGVEVGGAGFGLELESAWQDRIVAGIRGVMAVLQMIEPPSNIRPARQLIYRDGRRVNPSVGGLLRSMGGGPDIGTPVERNALLGEVYSPYSFEVLEELRSPANGVLFYVSRDHPVNPGDWAFGVASTEGTDARWIETMSEGPA